jgi:hypothetical protein
VNACHDPREFAAAAFAEMKRSPAQHLRLALFGVIARVIESCTEGDIGAALEQHPFLADYLQEMQSQVACADDLSRNWRQAVAAWEDEALSRGSRLPLAALRDAGLSELEVELLLAVGLVEEDPRFGDVFEGVQRNERRPTFGVLMAWWRVGDEGQDRVESARRGLLELVRLGLIEVQKSDAPRAEWALTVPHALWDTLRGESPRLPWLKTVAHDELPALEDYVAPDSMRAQCAALASALQADPRQMLLVRGPANNGRKTLLGCVARSLGKSMLVADAGVFEEEPRWRLFGVLCALVDAMPVLHCELAAGETRPLPALPFVTAPLGIATSRLGAWSSADARPVLSVELPLPDFEARLAQWRSALPACSPEELPPLAQAARLTSGNIRRAARAAAGFAALAGHSGVGVSDLQQACRGLQSARLETLATRLPLHDGIDDLCVDEPTREELDALATRCRLREQLAASEGAAGNVGVRALLAGGSGTGKTLAARILAASLGKDLYRVDLAATVSKYLGETEKSLNQAFAAAEELDVVLLLDEGDSLMAGRTDVGSSNDRYANLETNFLLQRIESFDGILIVTSNSAERIDKAFARRMDVVIHFRPPDEWQRYRILGMHLEGQSIEEDLLQEIAARCNLTGAQIRNVVLHARLLSIQSRGPLGVGHLHAALLREYRKIGGHCPLRVPASGAAGALR